MGQIRCNFIKDEFIVTWQTATGPKDVAEKLGRSVASVQSYAVRLRKTGEPLKKFVRGRKKK